MAAKKYFVDIDLNQNELVGAVLQNTTTAGIANPVAGQIIFDTDTDTLQYHDGTNWQSAETRLDGALQYKGGKAHDAAAVTNPQVGDLYVFTSTGTATYYGNQVVEIGDFAICKVGGTVTQEWDVIQRNTVYASTSTAGVVQLATDGDTITGSNTTYAITPANLTAWAGQTNKTVTRKRVFSGQQITTSGTTLTHEIGTDNPHVTVYDSTGAEIEVLIEKGSGTVTLTVNGTNKNNNTVVISA